MDLSLSSILFGNYSNLLFISFQVIILIVSFILYRKKKALWSIALILLMYFMFSLYLVWEFYESYTSLKNIYSHSGVVPLFVILSGISQTEVFFIIVTAINALALIMAVIILRKDLN